MQGCENPVYSREIGYIKEELGLSMIINPEYAAAMEMGRVLKFPSAVKIDTFVKGRIELIRYRIPEGNVLHNMALKDISAKLHCDVLICVVERGEEVVIPDGNFVLQEKDTISIVASAQNAIKFFKCKIAHSIHIYIGCKFKIPIRCVAISIVDIFM